jgi:hypothetical protein
MVRTVPKPTNTRHNSTVKWSVPVKFVPTKTKTTDKLLAPTKRRRQKDDGIQPTKSANQLYPKPVEAE